MIKETTFFHKAAGKIKNHIKIKTRNCMPKRNHKGRFYKVGKKDPIILFIILK